MADVFHSGELEVQEQAGVRGEAAKIGTGIRAEITPDRLGFLRARRFVIVASTDHTGAVWTSLLTGSPSFLEPVDARTLRIHASPLRGDPLREGLVDGADVGLIAIDLASRKRLRLNGRVVMLEGGFDVVVREVFGNCPKYIQARVPEDADGPPAAPVASTTTRLDDGQERWVSEADTFFLGSRYAERGADASHRGGNPGFVRVLDASRLAWPDYSGNRMFQTLGNLARDRRARAPVHRLRHAVERCSSQAGRRSTGTRSAARASPGAERVDRLRDRPSRRDRRACRHPLPAARPIPVQPGMIMPRARRA